MVCSKLLKIGTISYKISQICGQEYILLFICIVLISSRILEYNVETGITSVLAKGFHYANGVEMHRDGRRLLLNEFSSRRVLEIQISGPNKGKAEIL